MPASYFIAAGVFEQPGKLVEKHAQRQDKADDEQRTLYVNGGIQPRFLLNGTAVLDAAIEVGNVDDDQLSYVDEAGSVVLAGACEGQIDRIINQEHKRN